MPNYGLVIDSTYNPISYEQYASPFIQYAEVYNKIADQYDALEMEANKWEKLANDATTIEEYRQYQSYANKIKAAADDLAENGLNSRTRSTLSQLRGDYAKIIQPISDAWDIREKERELQRQALISNPDIMFDRDAAASGLKPYMHGTPTLKTYNGARLYEYTSKAVEQLAQTAREDLMENGANSEWYRILGGQYFQKDNYKGVTADVVMQSMFDANGNIKPEANKYLNAIANGAIELSGMRDWDNWEDIKARAYSYVNQGLWGAIGSEEEKQLSNKYYEYALSQATPKNNTGIPINPRNIYSRKKQKEGKELYEAAKNYITVDNEGNWEIGNPHKQSHPTNGESYDTYLTTDSGYKLVKIFKEEWKKRTGQELSDSEANAYMLNPQHKRTVGNLIKTHLYNIGALDNEYDATRYTEYNYAYDSEQQKEIKNAILPLLDHVNLQAVEWDDEKATYAITGEELTAKDLQEATILESNFSVINGNTYNVISVQHKDGSIGTYKMPVGINRQNEAARDQSLRYAENCRIELNKIAKDPNTINPKTGKSYTKEEQAALYSAYQNHLQNAYKATSQIGLKYKTQDVTMQGYGY